MSQAMAQMAAQAAQAAETKQTKTGKPVNWPAETTAELVRRYAANAGESVATIAKALGKTDRAVIMKLSSLGIYVKPAKASKKEPASGDKVLSKGDLADKIASRIDLTPEDADSLAKANKGALVAVLAALMGLTTDPIGEVPEEVYTPDEAPDDGVEFEQDEAE